MGAFRVLDIAVHGHVLESAPEIRNTGEKVGKNVPGSLGFDRTKVSSRDARGEEIRADSFEERAHRVQLGTFGGRHVKETGVSTKRLESLTIWLLEVVCGRGTGREI
jgi:hypothetical protein